jgi:integrase
MTLKRHRSVPITETMTRIAGYPDKLVLFKIAASPFWWVRYYAQKKIVKKSTKTEVKKEAIEFAKNFHADITARIHRNLPIGSSPTFERCADALIAEQDELIARGELNEKLNLNDRSILKPIKEHFKGMDIRSLTYKHINTYLAELSSKKINEGRENERKISPATIKKHSILISKILKYAQRENIVERIPSMPSVRMKDSPRGWFSHDQYVKLRTVLANIESKTIKVRNHIITDELRLLTTFMVNTFLRPSDLKNLRHRNIEIVEKEQNYLRIITEQSKTENTPIVSMDEAVGIYRDILELHEGYKKDDFVFFPNIKNRNTAMETMRRQFDKVLQIADLKRSPSGEPRTLYSLRHTAIMFRLTKGEHIDLLTLARNARTSVEMIERFYAKPLQAEMNIAQLQSRRKDSPAAEAQSSQDLPSPPTKIQTKPPPAKTSKSLSDTKKSSRKPVRNQVE